MACEAELVALADAAIELLHILAVVDLTAPPLLLDAAFAKERSAFGEMLTL